MTRRVALALLGLLLTATACTPKATQVGGVQTSRAPSATFSPAPSGTAPLPPASLQPLASVTPSPTPSGKTSTLDWLIASSAVSMLLKLDQAVTAHYFDNGRTMVIGSVPSGWSSLRVLSFTSLAGIRQAIDAGLPPNVRGIVYDIEAWSLTPTAEQQNPVGSIATAGKMVHAAGRTFIAAPGTDLMGVIYPGQGPYNQTYIANHFAASAVDSADVFVVQAQAYQNDLATYADLVRKAAAQVRTGHAGVLVFAGLSTGPHGQAATAGAMVAAVTATVGAVDGYWLNIPGQGPQCPTCGPPQPGIALDFLRKLGG